MIKLTYFAILDNIGGIYIEIQQHQWSTLVNFNNFQFVLKKCVPVSSYNFVLAKLKKGPSNTLSAEEEG